jgi:hypothetical protein
VLRASVVNRFRIDFNPRSAIRNRQLTARAESALISGWFFRLEIREGE